MKIISRESYIKETEQEYFPTPEELYYYYSGTHGGLNPNNPYNIKNKTKITRFVKYSGIYEKKDKCHERSIN